MTHGKVRNISEGRASSRASKHARATIAAWKGNSGGGIFTKNQELAGIVSKIGIGNSAAKITIPIPKENSILLVKGTIKFRFPLSNWLLYSDANKIKKGLDAKNLSFTYMRTSQSKMPIYRIYSTIVLYTLGVLLCVFIFRKHIFS